MEEVVLKEGEQVIITHEREYGKTNQEITVKNEDGRLIIAPSMSDRKYKIAFSKIKEIEE
jgi:hypothetical protein